MVHTIWISKWTVYAKTIKASIYKVYAKQDMGTVFCPMFRFSKAFFTWVLKRSKFGYNLKRSFLRSYGGESRDSPLFSIWFHHFNTSMSYTSFVQRLFHIRSWSRNSLTSTWYTPMYKWLLYVTLRVFRRPVCSMDLSTIITSLWICLQLLLLLWIQMRSPGSSIRELFMTSEALAQTYPEKVWLAPAKSSCHKYFV